MACGFQTYRWLRFLFFHFILWPVFMGRLSGSLGGLDRSHTCRAPLGGGRIYGGTGLVLFAIHVSEFWFFGGPTVLGINPPAASFVLRLARVRLPSASALLFASSYFFFLPTLHSLWNDAGFSHSGVASVCWLLVSLCAAHFCGTRACWCSGSRFIKALIKAGGVVPCLGMTDPG